ncbi:thiolase family protein [Mycobacterium sp. OTB74]|jgi:acetyl-CoA acetyltransferase|uniref:thiolase C-terminal domain-containing protein n=1 Tax=Mycobacterium sp. OTB74 TaxID=1853452 RepID=UPI002475203D|nr:thiolase family protein [Mycobacterium sp. OTB74]MDH6246485.1 acetyl-CoA acetyltransferase [Mycobacterium sp. OTB74]
MSVDGPRAAVIGYAHSAVRRGGVALGSLAVQTARTAIADAGLRVDQIDGFVGSALLPTAGAHAIVDGLSTVSSAWLAQHLGADPRYVAGFDGIGQLVGSVAMAVNAIGAGAANYVVVHRALHNPAGTYHGNPMHQARGHQQWTAPQGFFGPLAMIALPYTEYLQRYGAQRESMAAVVVEARKNGATIPWSYWYGKPLSAQDYLSADPLFDPVCRYDCDIPVDGVATFVLTSPQRAADGPHRPVYVAGYANSAPPRGRMPQHWPLDDIMAGGAQTVKRLWENTGLSIDQIDLPQLYDGFSPLVWFWLEALGICPVGQAHHFAATGGINADDAAAIPALSGGGALGNGRMHGIPQMLECYLQLSGRAGVRQRPAVDTALACHSSPHYGGAVAYTIHPK